MIEKTKILVIVFLVVNCLLMCIATFNLAMFTSEITDRLDTLIAQNKSDRWFQQNEFCKIHQAVIDADMHEMSRATWWRTFMEDCKQIIEREEHRRTRKYLKKHRLREGD